MSRALLVFAALLSIRPSWIAMAVIVAGGLWLPACGGSDSPSAPATPAPTPTPVPPITFSLTAPDGYYEFSGPLIMLAADESFEISFTPVAANEGDSGFSNTVEFWLWSPGSNTEDFFREAIALGFTWDAGSEYFVFGFTPENPFQRTGQRVPLQLGTQYSVRVRRTNDGTSEFSLDGNRLLLLPDDVQIREVRARVVGFEADFAFAQGQNASPSTGSTARLSCQDGQCGGASGGGGS
jgi:hypothetical protein